MVSLSDSYAGLAGRALEKGFSALAAQALADPINGYPIL